MRFLRVITLVCVGGLFALAIGQIGSRAVQVSNAQATKSSNMPLDIDAVPWISVPLGEAVRGSGYAISKLDGSLNFLTPNDAAYVHALLRGHDRPTAVTVTLGDLQTKSQALPQEFRDLGNRSANQCTIQKGFGQWTGSTGIPLWKFCDAFGDLQSLLAHKRKYPEAY